MHGDTGATSGTQTLVVKNGTLTERLTALLVGSTGYINGNATALHHVIGLTSAQSSKYAGKWLSFPTSNNGLAQLVSGPPRCPGAAASCEMTRALHLRHRDHGERQARAGHPRLPGHADGARCPSSSTSRPPARRCRSRRSPTPAAGSGASAIHGTVAFSSWGEKTSEQAPAHSVSLLKLVPGATSSGATSTTAG